MLILVCLFVFENVMMDRASEIAGNDSAVEDDYNQNVMSQFCAILMLALMGIVALFPFNRKLGFTHFLLLAYPVGMLMFEFISIFLLIFNIYFSLLTVFIVYALLLFIIYFTMIKKKEDIFDISKDNIIKSVFYFALIATFGYFLSKIPISVISFDSVQFKMLGDIYAKEHYFVDYAKYLTSGYTLIPTIINSIAFFFSFNFAYAIQTVFLLNSLLLFGYFVYYTSRKKGFDNKESMVFSVLSFLLLSTSFFVIFMGVCLAPTIFAGFFVLFFMYYMQRYLYERKNIDFYLSLLFIIAFCFTRVEGPLVVVFTLGYFAHINIESKKLRVYILSIFAVLAMWYSSFFIHFGTKIESAFLTLDKIIMIMGLFVVLFLYGYFKNLYFNKYNDKLLKTYIGAVILFTIGMHVLNPDKLSNIMITFDNLAYKGFWTISWFSVMLLGIIAILINKKSDRFIERFILIFMFLFFAIFTFRENNLRKGWSDSGNRMLMHIYPLILYTIYDNISSFFAYCKRKKKIVE